MAKPLYAKEQSDYGIDLTNSTESSPLYLYHVLPLYQTPAKWAEFGQLEFRRPAVKIQRQVGASTTLHLDITFGGAAAAKYEETGSISTSFSAQRETTQNPQGYRFTASGDFGYTHNLYIVSVVIRAWADGTGTTKLNSLKISEENALASGDFFGFGEHPHQTAADRLYTPGRALSAYHVRRLLTASVNALVFSAGLQVSIPIFGAYP